MLKFRKEVKNMKNIRELVRNVLMIGGLSTAGVSFGDGLVASVADKEHQAFMSTRAELQEKYGVRTHCASGGGPFETYCSDHVASVDESEESRILKAYYEELSEKVSAIPSDMAGRRRQGRDIAGLFGGLAITGLADRLKRKRSK